MRKIVLFILLLSLISFSNPLTPFGLYTNQGLVLNEGFFLLGVNFSGNFLLNQDIFSAEDLNVFLETGTINLNNINKLSLNTILNASGFGTLKLGNFAISTYIYLNGNIDLKISDQIKDFLIDPITIDTEYNISEKFIDANVFFDAGVVLNLGKFFIAPYVFLPILYSGENQYLEFTYTSSASPAMANLHLSEKADIYSSFPLDNDSYEIKGENLGMAFSFGISTDSFGIAINNIQIKPSVATYKSTLDLGFDFSYSAQGTDITADVSGPDATLTNFQEDYMEVSKTPEITAYYKTSIFFLKLGARGKYTIGKKDSWDIGVFGYTNLLFFTPYYSLDYLNSNGLFVHNFGFKTDLRVFYTNINVKSISHTFSPFDDASFGISVNFGFGI
ncbi:hypothetical protein XJ44_05130 [Thermosipho affectus]|uniref:DUF5723 domain-containing protein n=1 Tax=Thermosipho affectus TaxID=660294 RepID=A0ABX3IIM2_9BACT|nr:hypothetical protein [Thermosipho affectus]ONN27169.1 hypothetical protein XJ44_05130 [Thermosipho affectus]